MVAGAGELSRSSVRGLNKRARSIRNDLTLERERRSVLLVKYSRLGCRDDAASLRLKNSNEVQLTQHGLVLIPFVIAELPQGIAVCPFIELLL